MWERFLDYNSLDKVGFVRNAITHVEEAVWHWYKAIRGPSGISFGLLLLPTKNAYYLE